MAEHYTGTTGPNRNPLRRVFANYFKARFQNMQNIVTNDVFYNRMPAEWLTYQRAYVRQWDEWSRGFVLQLHRGDMFSVGMGYTVCEILTRECMKGGFRFDGKDPTLNNFVTKWAKGTDAEEFVAKGFMNANRLGNNILRLNVVAGTSETYATEHGVDRVFMEINRRGEIVRARFIDYLSANTYDNSEFYVVEDRLLVDEVPYYRVKIFKNSGTVTAPTFEDVGSGLEKLDYFTKSRFADLYGDIAPDVWHTLPFRTLGCYNWKNKATSVSINSMPGYSDSSIHTALDVLYSIDYNWSMGQLDMYWGRTRVVVPPTFRKATMPTMHSGKDFGEITYEVEEPPLNDEVFLGLPRNDMLSDKPAQPFFIQPDLRGEVHKYIRDADLELLASKVGLSSSTLANHLQYNTSKTATEVETESDTTETTVANKREYAASAIDALIKDVLDFYGLVGEVHITWNQSGNNKRTRQNVLDEYSARVMPLKEAIKRLHPELTESEVQTWVDTLQAESEEADIFSDKSIFGGGGL